MTLCVRTEGGLARKVVRHNVTLHNLLPRRFDTARVRATLEGSAKLQDKAIADVLAAWMSANPAGRFGDPDEFGAECAFLCSVHARYSAGQNLLLGGGACPGTF